MKNKLINAAVFLLAFLVVFGCSTSKPVVYESKWNAPFTYVGEANPDGQDQPSRIRYGVINDTEHLYITLKTRDPNTIEQILTNGLRLSFSPAGRGTQSLLFPVVTRDDRRALQKIDLDLPNSLTLNRMIESFNKEALWKDRQGERFLNLVTNASGVRCQLSLDQNQELTQQFTIPFAMLGMNPQQVPFLELGIKTEGSTSQSGLSPRISVGMGSGGFGYGGGGVGFGLGNGGRTNPNQRDVNFRLQVKLARDSFKEDLNG